MRGGVVSSHEKPVAHLPIFGYCSCPSPMIRRFRFALLPLLGALLCSSCKREEIRVYTVAKQAPAATPAAEAAPEGQPRQHPKITYTLPPDWQDMGPNAMSLANFHIKTDAGEASVNVTPLGSMAGGESAIVNMWREQVGQPPLPDSEAAATLSPVEIGGESGQLFEISGQLAGKPLKIVTAFVHRSDGSWFYKMQGPDVVVTGQEAGLYRVSEIRAHPGSRRHGRAAAEAAPRLRRSSAGKSQRAGKRWLPARCRWRSLPCRRAVTRRRRSS